MAHALIIGAGPAGLAAAIGLASHGHDVHISEVKERDHVQGSELMLPSVLHPVLDALGVLEQVEGAGRTGSSMGVSSSPGAPVVDIPIPSVGGRPAIAITRPSLTRVLRERAEHLGAVLRFQDAPTIVSNDDDVVVVERSSGTDRYDLLIGADGAFSKTRTTVFPELGGPVYSGQGVWRARFTRTAGDPTRFLTIFYGPRQRKVGILNVDAVTSYLWMTEPADRAVRFDPSDFSAELSSRLSVFEGTVAGIADRFDSQTPVQFGLMHRGLLTGPWHRGRVGLIGDAAHTATPHISYGAGLSIEDGYVLGECVGHGGDVPAALSAFRHLRFQRCADAIAACELLANAELHPETTSIDAIEVTVRAWERLAERVAV